MLADRESLRAWDARMLHSVVPLSLSYERGLMRLIIEIFSVQNMYHQKIRFHRVLEKVVFVLLGVTMCDSLESRSTAWYQGRLDFQPPGTVNFESYPRGWLIFFQLDMGKHQSCILVTFW